MTDDGDVLLHHESVEGVDRSHAVVLDPRREDEEASKITPVLMRHDVIRIVAPRSEYLIGFEEAFPRAWNPGRHGAVAALRVTRHGEKEVFDVLLDDVTATAATRHALGAIRERELFPLEVDDVVLRYKIAESIEDLGRDHVGAGGHLEPTFRVESKKVELIRRVGDEDARAETEFLERQDSPLFVRRRRPVVAWASLQAFGTEAMACMSVLEPCAVHDVAHGVDAACGDDLSFRVALAGLSESVVEQHEDVTERACWRIDGGPERRIFLERVIRVELLGSRWSDENGERENQRSKLRRRRH